MRRMVRLLILLLCAITMSAAVLGCNQAQPTTTKPAATATRLNAIQTWIKQQAIPLKTTDPNAPLNDLAPLQPLVGSATIVGLGEATHGSHEFFTMKHRMLEFLVEKMGFTMFAMEGSWSAGEKINQYVLTGQGNAEDVLRQFYFWTWNTREVLALVEWVRAYDADPNHTQKVQFAAFDCQNIESNTYDSVIQYVQAVDPQSVASISSLYNGLRPDPGTDMRKFEQVYAQLSQSTRQQYLKNARQVYNFLTQHKALYEAHSSGQAFTQALQEARVIVQSAQYYGYDQSDAQQYQAAKDREAFMAENIGWLHEHAVGGTKLVLWAHDAHIQTIEGNGYTTMGMYVRERYHSQYLALGTSFYEGSFNARGVDSHGNLTSIQPFSIQATPGSYNYTFGSIGLPLYALDLRHIPGGAVGQWMEGPQPFLTLSEVYTGNPTTSYSYAQVSLPQCFDMIIFIRKVTASQLIPLNLN